MSDEKVSKWLLMTVSVVLWSVIILVPLGGLFAEGIFAGQEQAETGSFKIMLNSFFLAFVIGGLSTVLGYVPGKLLGTSQRGKDLLLLVLLMSLVLPRYVLYYAWTLLLSPTTALGRYLSGNPEVAQFVGAFSSSMVLVLWYWPLAALLIGQGWRNIDRQIWESARLDGKSSQIFRKITLPLLSGTIGLSFMVCFVLSLSEFTTFHLAGIETIGTELAVLYELTGSVGSVVRAASPVLILALVPAVILGRCAGSWSLSSASSGSVELKAPRWQLFFLIILITVSLLVPIGLLVANVTGMGEFKIFFKLHMDELGWSLAVGIVTACLSYLIAVGVLVMGGLGKVGRVFSAIVCMTIFLAMFIPASLTAVSMVKIMAVLDFPVWLSQGWYVVSFGQSARFTGAALILLVLMRSSEQKHLLEMASVDGASWLKAFWHVSFPRSWRLFLAAFILILIFSVTELSATMVLLPAGLPNFAQRLLNQMHYARDQQVIASCLILISVFMTVAAVLVFLLGRVRMRSVWVSALVLLILSCGGCERQSDAGNKVKVIDCFGQTGRGQGEFVYPRAIDIADDGTVFVIDKTGRIQRLSCDGQFLGQFQMPLVDAGKPTGLSFGPEGRLYVADTHYHRVLIMSPEGQVVGQFGKFGEGEGCFIYPTDVAFSGDGRIFVSEYGGNDRISVFNEEGEFLYSFGTPGNGQGQLSRPSGLCVDRESGRLYVADACNHRIVIYNFDGKLLGYIGSMGRGKGQLRYPYDLTLLADGSLAVCEYGNNRLQLFSSDGRSLGVYGQAGRELGELAYPWGLAIDGRGYGFVVDAGNNRIQVWKF